MYLLSIAVTLVFGAAADDDCCQPGDTKPVEGDCTQYYGCCTGKFVLKSCPSGQYWNSNNQQCEPDNGQCVPVEPGAPGAPCAPGEPGAPGACTEGDTKVDASDCTKYQVCKNGEYVSASCNSGYYWNSANSQCEQDNGQCVSVTCKDGELSADSSDCAGYFICLDNKLVKRKCASQTYFDASLETCVIDTEGVCIPKVCDSECCDKPNNWIGPVDKNCSAFIHCLYGQLIQQTCPNNLQFNNITKQCDFPDVVQCDDGSPPPSGPTAGPSGTYCESKGRCVGQRDGAMFADAKSASSGGYIVCQCECEINFNCVAGLVFNEKIRTCDWP